LSKGRGNGSPRKRLVNIPIVAIHEAGHAVARFLTAEAMGVELDAAVSYVQIHCLDTAPQFTGIDGDEYLKLGEVSGPTYSKQLKEAARKIDAQSDLDTLFS
jgi:hypothetical protein